MPCFESVHLADLWNETAKNLAYMAHSAAPGNRTRPGHGTKDAASLDEPAAGMNPQETRELEILVRRIREERPLPYCLSKLTST